MPHWLRVLLAPIVIESDARGARKCDISRLLMVPADMERDRFTTEQSIEYGLIDRVIEQH